MVTAVRSDDSGDTVNVSSGLMRQASLYPTFRMLELKLRRDMNMDSVFNELESGGRNDFEGWLNYAQVLYRHLTRILAYENNRTHWFQRWRFQRYVADQKAMAQVYESLITPMSGLGEIRGKDKRRKIRKGQVRMMLSRQRGYKVPYVKKLSRAPVFGWGSAGWSGKGQPPAARKKLYKYAARRGLVLLLHEFGTSQACPCDESMERRLDFCEKWHVGTEIVQI